jgi:hypothetical protein
MNKTVRNIGLAALAVGVLYYPAMRLFRAAAAKRRQLAEEDHTDHQPIVRRFAPAYRGSTKPHRRKA